MTVKAYQDVTKRRLRGLQRVSASCYEGGEFTPP
jgi:hypothetical protein